MWRQKKVWAAVVVAGSAAVYGYKNVKSSNVSTPSYALLQSVLIKIYLYNIYNSSSVI